MYFVADLIPADLRPLLSGLWHDSELRSPPATDGAMEYVVLPNWDDPRLLLPLDSSASAARGMLDFSDAVSAGAAIKRLAAAAGLRVGAARMARTRLSISDGDAIEDRLSAVMRQPVNLVIGVGTKRANRKPVIRIMSKRGRLIAVAKLGTTPLTADLVVREYEALQRLASKRFGTLTVPSPIALEDWHGVPLLVMTSLPTRPKDPWRKAVPPKAAMNELATSFTGATTTLAASAFMTDLENQIDRCSDADVAGRMRPLLAAVRACDSGAPLEAGAWHGDFTPWNMSRRGERVSLWDWEQFTQEVPIGLDFIHFHVNQATTASGMTTDAVVAGLLAAERELNVDTFDMLRLAYLSAIAVRYSIGFARSGESGLGRSAEIMRECLFRAIRSIE